MQQEQRTSNDSMQPQHRLSDAPVSQALPAGPELQVRCLPGYEEPRQLIDYKGRFIEEAKSWLAMLPKAYLLPILGPQGSGKSSALNEMFGACFDVYDDTAGLIEMQTTQGIWVVFRFVNDIPILAVDVQGFDDMKADQEIIAEEGAVEARLAIFVLQISSIIIFNVGFEQIGQMSGGGMNILTQILHAAGGTKKSQDEEQHRSQNAVDRTRDKVQSFVSRNSSDAKAQRNVTDENNLLFWTDMMRKGTAALFLLRNRTSTKSRLPIIKNNVDKVWTQAYGSKFAQRLPASQALPVMEHALPSLVVEKDPESEKDNVAEAKAKFRTEVAKVMHKMLSHFKEHPNAMMSADEVFTIWNDSVAMAGNVKWAGSLAAQRARHECQTMALPVLEELETRIRTQVDSRGAFEKTITEISGLWLSALSEDTKFRKTIVKEESDRLVSQMKAAVDREVNRREDVRKAKVAAEQAYEARLAEQHEATLRAQEQYRLAEEERVKAEEARISMAREIARSEEDRRQAEEDRRQLQQALDQARNEAEQARVADQRRREIGDLGRAVGQLLEDKLDGQDVDEGILDAAAAAVMDKFVVDWKATEEERGVMKTYIDSAKATISQRRFEEMTKRNSGFWSSIGRGLRQTIDLVYDSLVGGLQRLQDVMEAIGDLIIPK